jgi:hypothetical protein
MNDDIHRFAGSGNLEGVKQLVEGGANIEMIDGDFMTALSLASLFGHFDLVVYLVERSADIAHANSTGMTALHLACSNGKLASVKYLLEHGATITERDDEGATALLYAAKFTSESLEVVEYLLSSEGGASITEKDNDGGTALLWAGSSPCHPTMVQWLLEYGGAQITDTDYDGDSVWTYDGQDDLPNLLRGGYTKGDDGDYVSISGEYVPNGDTVALTAMLRVMTLHGGPPESLATDLAPPFQRIVQDGARLCARLPAYLTQRRALLDTHCPLLPPLQDLVHGYEVPTTTDELWATGVGSRM